MEDKIQGGATLWARQTIDSEIFIDKPDKWFKIWFYLVNRASHQDTKLYKRGECFIQYEWIAERTKATPDQIKKCISWLKQTGAVSTARSTRGVTVYLPKYSHFQCLDNYYSNVKAPQEALEKHQRSTTIHKNDKNDKNKYIAETSSTPEVPFDQDQWLESLAENKSRAINLIGYYFKEKKVSFPSKKAATAEMVRWMKDAQIIIEYDEQKIVRALRSAKEKYPDWKLSAVKKELPTIK